PETGRQNRFTEHNEDITRSANQSLTTRMNGVARLAPVAAEGTNGFQACARAPGRRVTMPIVMIKEMPFPIPRSVIWSPSHIKNNVPVVNDIVVMMLKLMPGLSTRYISSL